MCAMLPAMHMPYAIWHATQCDMRPAMLRHVSQAGYTWGGGMGHACMCDMRPAMLRHVSQAGIKTVVNGPTIWAADGAGQVGASALEGEPITPKTSRGTWTD